MNLSVFSRPDLLVDAWVISRSSQSAIRNVEVHPAPRMRISTTTFMSLEIKMVNDKMFISTVLHAEAYYLLEARSVLFQIMER